MQTQTQVTTQFSDQELHQLTCLVGRYINTLRKDLDSENDTEMATSLETYIKELKVIQKKASQIRWERHEVFFSLLPKQAEGK